jgi:hypothetical protein
VLCVAVQLAKATSKELWECQQLRDILTAVVQDRVAGKGRIAAKFFAEIMDGNADVFLVFSQSLKEYLTTMKPGQVKKLGVCFDLISSLPEVDAEMRTLFVKDDQELAEDDESS